jgi:hypothetical protein
MKCDSQPSHLARTFVSPCLGRDPKARVATIKLLKLQNNNKVNRKMEKNGFTKMF